MKHKQQRPQGFVCAMSSMVYLLSLGSPVQAQQQLTPEQRAGQTVLEYDPVGNVTAVHDGRGVVTRNQYDALSRLKKVTLPAPAPEATEGSVSYAYDGLGRLVSVSDPRQNTTTYTYSGFNDLTQRSPDTGELVTVENNLGLMAERGKTDESIYQLAQYDKLGRLLRQDDQVGYTQFRYDEFSTVAGSENYGKGRLTRVTEYVFGKGAQSQVLMRYDPLGRLLSRCQTQSTAPSTCVQPNTAQLTAGDAITYTWGGATEGARAGRLKTITYPSGRRVVLARDSFGRVSGVSLLNPGASSTVPVLSSITYRTLGVETATHAVTGWVFGANSGQRYVRDYDDAGRIVTYTLGRGQTAQSLYGLHSLSYDEAGRIQAIDRYTGTWSTAVFDHDDQNRLVGHALDGMPLFAYSYDANGNRLTRQAINAQTSYTVAPDSNRIQTVQLPGQTSAQAVVHDPHGNITQDPGAPVGAVRFIYDQRTTLPFPRMAQTQGPGGLYTYQYNHFGNRIRKTGSSFTNAQGVTVTPAPEVGGTDTYYYHDEAGHLLAEVDAVTRKVKREYIWLDDIPVAIVAGANPEQPIDSFNAPTVYYVHADHLNTPRLVTDAAKVSRWNWSPLANDAFGSTMPIDAPRGQVRFVMNLRMPGQYFDRETGTYFNHYRQYNPATGRYLQSDPIGLEGGLNTYAYVGGNPLSYVDANGLRRGNGAAHRRPPSWSFFGCVGLGCVSSGPNDVSAQLSAELTLGGGIEICDPPPEKCDKANPFQPPGLPLPERAGGLFIGPSIKNDGRFCIKIGPHIGVPFVPSVDMGGLFN
ncbi:RHS repeat domain-containing protein [Aquabacterium lacunae]|nr:RHS repeat protein [Aquabacterium lacunae]